MKPPAWLNFSLPEWAQHLNAAARHKAAEPVRRLEQLRVPSKPARQRTAAPSARELFPLLRARLLASRPYIGQRENPAGDITPIYGAPTFRNVIDESGRHV